jgi:hypothetical protein
MTLWSRLRSWLGATLRRARTDSEMDAELRFHLEAYAEDLVRNGVPRQEALRRARLEFGGVDKTKEECREARGMRLIETLMRDLHYSTRALRKSPGFTTVAVLTLALGIGANTAIFSAVDALMLRPLPFPASNELVRIYSIQKGMFNTFGNPDGPSLPDVRDFAQRSHSFQNIVVYDTWRKNVNFGDAVGQPEQMPVGLVPAGYFEVLGIRPIVGRLFTEDENQEGKNYVAAIGASLWRSRYAGDLSILGRKIRINGEPYTVVAVMPDVIPSWMEPGRHSEIWTPFAFSDAWSESSRGGRGWATLARLKPGVSLEQAQADLSVIAAALASEHPGRSAASDVVPADWRSESDFADCLRESRQFALGAQLGASAGIGGARGFGCGKRRACPAVAGGNACAIARRRSGRTASGAHWTGEPRKDAHRGIATTCFCRN